MAGERPVTVDWLPWSHTFGGNHNMNMMLTCGGTIYVDAGRPAPGMFAQTIANGRVDLAAEPEHSGALADPLAGRLAGRGVVGHRADAASGVLGPP